MGTVFLVGWLSYLWFGLIVSILANLVAFNVLMFLFGYWPSKRYGSDINGVRVLVFWLLTLAEGIVIGIIALIFGFWLITVWVAVDIVAFFIIWNLLLRSLSWFARILQRVL